MSAVTAIRLVGMHDDKKQTLIEATISDDNSCQTMTIFARIALEDTSGPCPKHSSSPKRQSSVQPHVDLDKFGLILRRDEPVSDEILDQNSSRIRPELSAQQSRPELLDRHQCKAA